MPAPRMGSGMERQKGDCFKMTQAERAQQIREEVDIIVNLAQSMLDELTKIGESLDEMENPYQ